MLNEIEIGKRALQFMLDADNSEKLSRQRDRAITYQDFRNGIQWTKESWDLYKSKGVTPVTKNRCKPIIKGMMGLYLNSRQSVRVRPRRGGTESAAQVWSETIKHAEDQSNADYIYACAFEDGLVDSESFICFDVDESKTVNGQPVLRSKSLFDVDIDPNCDIYNINDKEEGAKYAIIKDWVDKEIIEVNFPDFDYSGVKSGYDGDTSMGIDTVAGYLADEGNGQDRRNEYEDDELKRKYKYRIRTIWWKEVTPGIMIVDGKTGISRIISAASGKKTLKAAKKAKKDGRYNSKKHPAFILHKTTMLGTNMLEDKPSPFGTDCTDLPVFRFSPYYYQGFASGQLDDVVSLNEMENIFATQTVKILNKTANAGWEVKKVMNAPDLAELRNFGDVDGFVLDKSKFGGEVKRTEATELPLGHYTMMNQFEEAAKNISGIDDSTGGMDTGKSESGRAIGLKQRQNKVSSETAFDKFYYTLELLGEYMLLVIRKNNIYTNEEIKNIVAASSLIDEAMMAKARLKLEGEVGAGLPEPQPMAPIAPEFFQQIKTEDKPGFMETIQTGQDSAMEYEKAYPTLKLNYDEVVKRVASDMLLESLRDDVIAEYGVKVTTSPTAPTEMMLQWVKMEAINQAYPGSIPFDIMIDATDLSKKDEIKAKYQQMQQQQARPQAVA
jgi:hypothetical protein